MYREEDSQRVSNKHVHVFMIIFVPNYIDPGAFKINHISQCLHSNLRNCVMVVFLKEKFFNRYLHVYVPL